MVAMVILGTIKFLIARHASGLTQLWQNLGINKESLSYTHRLSEGCLSAILIRGEFLGVIGNYVLPYGDSEPMGPLNDLLWF